MPGRSSGKHAGWPSDLGRPPVDGHGTAAKFDQGCRCMSCSKANAAYLRGEREYDNSSKYRSRTPVVKLDTDRWPSKA